MPHIASVWQRRIVARACALVDPYRRALPGNTTAIAAAINNEHGGAAENVGARLISPRPSNIALAGNRPRQRLLGRAVRFFGDDSALVGSGE